MDDLQSKLHDNRMADCETTLLDSLASTKKTPFHIVSDLEITSDPVNIAAFIDHFFLIESSQYEVRALYAELNSFDLKANRWYCNVFAYDQDQGGHDFDWLYEFEAEESEDYDIHGMEPLQAVYASDAAQHPRYQEAMYLTNLAVIVKFQRFMQQAMQQMSMVNVPIYVSARDFDFVVRLESV